MNKPSKGVGGKGVTNGSVGSSERVDQRRWLSANEEDDEPHDTHVDPYITGIDCSSQNRMSISRYIVVAVARCSCASCRWPVRW